MGGGGAFEPQVQMTGGGGVYYTGVTRSEGSISRTNSRTPNREVLLNVLMRKQN